MATGTHAPAVWHTVVSTSLGELTLVRDSYALRGVYFPHHWYMPNRAAFGEQVEECVGPSDADRAEHIGAARQKGVRQQADGRADHRDPRFRPGQHQQILERAVEQAGLTTLHEGQRVSFDEVMDQKRGKKAQNLKAV